ncbi:FecR family protein [Gilvibacter sediminis]|uniref:FecR family protein n=1 Tax=Gilvibacter sediminis TaxID=379071 RepID=UPI00234FC257|nr:FecR domain-containing protein [Gilvibacter sediminis]MDC7999144.1 FecR domain-containing protein [Gilvibacter sediminis]
MDEKLLHKWLNDDLTEQELKQVEQDPEYGYYKALLADAKAFKADQFSQPKDFEEVLAALPKKEGGRLQYLRPLMRIAAILVIALGVYFTLFNDDSTKVATALAEQKTVVLPDNSEVALNAGSNLSFSEDSWAEAREVQLNGEAYFKVAKGQVFDVISKQGKVTVLGTEFNVMDRGEFFQVVCYEGRVAVTYGDAKQELLPGDAIRFFQGEARIFKVNDSSPSWIANKSSFDAVSVALVLDELERYYEVDINASPSILKRQFTGAFTHENLEQALKQLTTPLQLTYTINGTAVTLSE